MFSFFTFYGDVFLSHRIPVFLHQTLVVRATACWTPTVIGFTRNLRLSGRLSSSEQAGRELHGGAGEDVVGRPAAASGWGDHCRLDIEAGYLSGFILAMNSPPVSTSVRSPECAADFIRSTDVSLCPFTVLARGTIPPPIEVIVGTQAPLEMP